MALYAAKMVRSQENKEFWNALLCMMVRVQILLYCFPELNEGFMSFDRKTRTFLWMKHLKTNIS